MRAVAREECLSQRKCAIRQAEREAMRQVRNEAAASCEAERKQRLRAAMRRSAVEAAKDQARDELQAFVLAQELQARMIKTATETKKVGRIAAMREISAAA